MAAAIGWLVQTISATLKIDKLGAWIRQVGLADDIEKLKSEIWEVKKIVVSDAKDKGGGNELLDEAFALLEERLYEADDLVDELDYNRLQQQVQGLPAPADPSEPLPLPLPGATRGDADMPSNAGKLRSVVWEHFTITERDNGKPVKAECRHCSNEFKCDTKTNGTSSMKKHLENAHSVTCAPGAHPPNPSSTGEPIVGSSSGGKGKKRRSKAWDNYEAIENENTQPIKAKCKYCHKEIKCGGKTGTSGMHNHTKICEKKRGEDDQQPPNLPSTGDAIANVTHIVVGDSSSRKKSSVDEESAHIIAANTHTTPCDKNTISDRIQEIISLLQVIRGQVSEVLKLHGSDISSSSNHHQSTALDQHLSTSSIVPPYVCGRVAEKNNIIKMITEEKSDGVVVLPIVGIAGVGKTTLAQLVCNDPDVEHQFDQRIWVWVSRNFDKIRLTREMLNSISQERHEEITCFAKLPEILKSHANSKRLLIILDNVWDDVDDNIRWAEMLDSLVSSHVKGNVVLVTTRNIFLARRLGTLKPVKLGALANDDFWLLFKSRAFGYENCQEHPSLSIIGWQIAEKLKGNPLAAVSTGELLRKKLNTDYWRIVLKNEEWKYMHHNRGIMAALKLSYDQLPYHLQRCFSYCSIFPDSYQFLSEVLVGFWISQGFVKCNNSSRRLEDIGQGYLIDLVNMGFFEEVKREEPYLGSQVMYAICGLMHDFAMMEVDGSFPQILSKLYHLQVLDVGSYTDRTMPGCINNLVSLRHLVVHKGVYCSIATIDNMLSFQEQHGFKFHISSGFELTQLQSTEHWMHVNTLEDVYEAGLVNNELSEKLHLSWKDSPAEIVMEVEGWEPHWDLKVLQISGYDFALPIVVDNITLITSSQMVQIWNCSEWKILPFLERFQFLTKLELRNLPKVIEILVPSLEELALVKMPKLEKCSCTSVEGMSSRLRALQIEDCQSLKEFDLFENNDEFKTEQRSWAPNLRELSLEYCPHLKVLKPLPRSIMCSELLICGVSTLPYMKGSSDNKLCIGYDSEYDYYGFDESSDELKILDDKIFLFNNLKNLKSMVIYGCRNLRKKSLKGFSYLVSLTSLEIRDCEKLFASDEMPEHTLEDVTPANCKAFPSLEFLSIDSCGIVGKWLSLMLQHAPCLEELYLSSQEEENSDEEENSISNLSSTREGTSSGNPDDRLAPDRLLRIPLNLTSILKRITIERCPHLTFNWGKEGVLGFTSLEKLIILDRPDLLSSLVHTNGRWLLPNSLGELESNDHSQGTLQLCFPRDITSLKKLTVCFSKDLQSLQLHSCTALEELKIRGCGSLTALQGLQFLGSLRHLTVYNCPGLPPFLESFSRQGYTLLPRLKRLDIQDPFILTTSFCRHLTSLQHLKLTWLEEVGLTDEQEQVLVLLESLQVLVDLPAVLHNLPSLKSLKVCGCKGISRLPETGLPLSLEELEIGCCSRKLADQCRMLPRSRLNVKIELCF
ncbi:disease resistance RPP8-like protein 3 [Triticum urartu]|nr:disease resistance RPP8-like protein 3 [Triticum urartu]